MCWLNLTLICCYLLFWHEGQLRAELGATEAALSLFERAKLPPEEDDHIRIPWNIYVEATMAFVQRNRPALSAARKRSANVPQSFFAGKKGPPNLDVVDGLLECFEREYAEAYSKGKTIRSRK